MKELAVQTARAAGDSARNVLREYLQNYILLLMQKSGMSENLIFIGGSALRFVYRIRLFSEDMDFSARQGWRSTDLSRFSEKIARDLERAGYSFRIRLKEEKIVQKSMIRFSGLLHELGLSPRREENFSIHIEVDRNPPAGGKMEKTVVNIHHPVLIRHLDPSSALAGKLAAVLMRPYTKGRDLFDLFWFRSRWKELVPNLVYLNNALSQNTPHAGRLRESDWLERVRAKVEALDWDQVVRDVRPFLESEDDLTAFTREGMLLLLS